MGLVDEFELNSVSLGLYGFITVTQFKIIVIIEGKQINIQDMMMAIYEAYKLECLSPFSDVQPFEGTMSSKFERKVEALLKKG